MFCTTQIGAGGAGGDGGPGGMGGAGGGGSGGPSVGIFEARGSTAVVGDGSTVANGSGGPAGPGGNPGAAGFAQTIYDAGP